MIFDLVAFLWIGYQTAALDQQRASVEKQKNSVRQQAKLAANLGKSFFVISDPPEAWDCGRLPLLRQRALVDSASARAGIPADLLTAVIEEESGFRPCSVSPKGALGLMQLMPATAEDLGVKDALDPDQNVEGGAALLKELMDRYAGDLNRVLGAYNAGPRATDRANGVPAFPETLKYVEQILGRLQKPN